MLCASFRVSVLLKLRNLDLLLVCFGAYCAPSFIVQCFFKFSMLFNIDVGILVLESGCRVSCLHVSFATVLGVALSSHCSAKALTWFMKESTLDRRADED